MGWLRQLAFVQRVTKKREQGNEATSRREPDEAQTEAAPVETAAPIVSRVERPIVSSELRAEAEARISSFRAHQERFNRERERHASETLAKLRART